jgi:aerobic carbon-monoxide dehydrogenase large subunit
MRYVGSRVPRVEDMRILTGRGRYVDDLHLPGMAHAAFVRSPFPHARITSIDVSAAREAPGVFAVYTGTEMQAEASAFKVAMAGAARVPDMYPLPLDKVRLVGDLVVMVVARDRYEAEDACELVQVDYDPLPPVASMDQALDPSSAPIWEELGDNIIAHPETAFFGDVDAAFAEADQVFEMTLHQHRIANVPMETRGAVADFDAGTGDLNFHSATQGGNGLRMLMADTLHFPMEKIRVLTGDVGGSFGLKSGISREDLCIAVASRALQRPVKWIEDRNEHLLASGHAREERITVQTAVKDDGTILGIKADMVMDHGAYFSTPFPGAAFSELIKVLLPGPYKVKGYSFDCTVVSTNKAEYCAYRGPWEMETFVRERMLDVIAHEMDIDPAELRRRNLVNGDPDERIVTGLGVTGVSSRQSLDRALELIDYEGFRKEQVAARQDGRYLGIGFATFIEAAPGPPEMRIGGGLFGGDTAKVKLESDGHLTVYTAQGPHGQSHETTLAQIAADEFGVPFDHVRVVHGDTRSIPWSLIGTGGSRASTWASGAVTKSTRVLKAKVLALASNVLEIAPEDLEIEDGMITPKGVPEKAIPVAQIATQISIFPGTLPAGPERILEAHEQFTGEGITGSGWSGGSHVAVVEVSLETGRVKILRWLAVEDCGRIINPAVVEGQIRGGVAQGIGEVLFENCVYAEDGNFLAGTFMDYLLPTASEIPFIEIEHLELEADGELSFRGVGEAGAVVAPATLTNAVADALMFLGPDKLREQYLPPAKVLELAGVI